MGFSVTREPLERAGAMGVLPHAAGIYRISRHGEILYSRPARLSRVDREARANELIGLLEMEEFADRIAKGFSQASV